MEEKPQWIHYQECASYSKATPGSQSFLLPTAAFNRHHKNPYFTNWAATLESKELEYGQHELDGQGERNKLYGLFVILYLCLATCSPEGYGSGFAAAPKGNGGLLQVYPFPIPRWTLERSIIVGSPNGSFPYPPEKTKTKKMKKKNSTLNRLASSTPWQKDGPLSWRRRHPPAPHGPPRSSHTWLPCVGTGDPSPPCIPGRDTGGRL